jgi:hypothetical protein
MENSIKKCSELTENHLKLFNLLFNYIIPESKSKKIPGAALILDSSEIFSEKFMYLLSKSFLILELLIKNKSNRDLNSLAGNVQVEILNEFKKENIIIFNKLCLNIIKYYYSNEKVLKSIDINSTPPYPEGNSVLEGDLLLLEQVFLRAPLYRIY